MTLSSSDGEALTQIVRTRSASQQLVLEQALGQFVMSKSTISDITDRLAHEYEAFRTRDLRDYDIAAALGE
jgi:transposase-like protein